MNEDREIIQTKYLITVKNVSIEAKKTKRITIEQDVTDTFKRIIDGEQDYVGVFPEYQTDYLEINVINKTDNYSLESGDFMVMSQRDKRDTRYESVMHKRCDFSSSNFSCSVWDPIKNHTYRVYFKLKKHW